MIRKKFLINMSLVLIVALIGSSLASASTSVTVTANPVWTDTGLNIAKGKVVSITASGMWNCGGGLYGPNGDDTTDAASDYFLTSTAPSKHGELIAFIGPDPYQGHWGDRSFFPQPPGAGYWAMGSSGYFVSDRDGELWLGINDDAVSKIVGDNGGSLSANVRLYPSLFDYYLKNGFPFPLRF